MSTYLQQQFRQWFGSEQRKSLPGGVRFQIEQPGTRWLLSLVFFATQTFAVCAANAAITPSLFAPAQDFAAGPAGSDPHAMAVADFNGDGKPDLAVTNDLGQFTSGRVSVLLGNGNGTFQTPLSFAVGVRPWSVAVGDFNGDGKPDLAVANVLNSITTGSVSVLLNNSTGNGAVSFQEQMVFFVARDPSSVAVGDFNGDDEPDLAVTHVYVNTVGVLLGNGDGTFQGELAFAVGNAPFSVAVGYFNDDAKLDLVTANLNGYTVSVLLNNSPGNGIVTFQEQEEYSVGQLPRWVAVEDFDGDGNLDLAVANDGSYYVSVLLGNGDGTFKDQEVFSVYAASRTVAVGDFNGDGKPDMALTNIIADWVSVLLGYGDGTFQAAQTFAVGVYPLAVAAVGDFDGDGQLDLAVANNGSNTVSVLLNTTVLPPQQQAQVLIQLVTSLVTSGVLTKGQGNSLTTKLKNVTNFGGTGPVKAFIKEVQALVKSKRLTTAQGNVLIGLANALLDSLSTD